LKFDTEEAFKKKVEERAAKLLEERAQDSGSHVGHIHVCQQYF
jgi:hypothetical protein